jgi:hypothetical protein
MSDDQGGGGGHGKLGIGAAILAALAGVGKFADDCGRAGATAAHFGDDAARGARFGGIADDVGRAGAVGLEAGAHVPLGEGRLVNVVDDVAPGAGRSVEEAVVEVGKDVTFEVVTFDFPDEPEPQAAEGDPAGKVPSLARPPRVLSGSLAAELPKAGELVVVTGRADDQGTIAFGSERLNDAEIHARCAQAGARCVVITCKADPTCAPLVSGIGRIAVTRVSAEGSIDKRYAQLVYAALERGAKSDDIYVSRVEAKADKIVRSSFKRVQKRSP